MDRSNLNVGTRTEELLFQVLLVLDEINSKLDKQDEVKVADTSISTQEPRRDTKSKKR